MFCADSSVHIIIEFRWEFADRLHFFCHSFFKFCLAGYPSESTRKAGVQVSSYWPDRTAQMKPQRKIAATMMLNGISRKQDDHGWVSPSASSLRPSRAVSPQANATTVTELSGIRMAQMTGDISPQAAMLMPTTL